jgi:hypothetical protein
MKAKMKGRYLLEKVGGDEALVALVQGVEDALQLLIFLQMDVLEVSTPPEIATPK